MDQILNYLKRRANSTVLVAYSVFWAILHWEGLVALLFTDQNLIMEQYGLLKNEYLAQNFFGFRMQDSFYGWASEIIMFLLPFILAYLYVWWLPKLVINPCYRKETKYKIERRIIKMEADREISLAEKNVTTAKAETVKAEAEKVEAQTALANAKQEALQKSPEVIWLEEYEAFKKDIPNWQDILKDLQETVYSNGGRHEYINDDTLIICDLNDLIDTDDMLGNITLTDKGRAFLREYNKRPNPKQ